MRKQQYFNLLDDEYDKPPKNVVNMLNKSLEKNKHKIFYLKEGVKIIGAVTIFELYNNVFAIHELIIDKDFRNQGMGKKLMEKVHNYFKGIFIVKTTSAEKFYRNIGYKKIRKGFLCYINNEDVFSRSYWQ